MTNTLVAVLSLLATSATACPGSPVYLHAKCEMTVAFPDALCSSVAEEMISRSSHTNGWKDPHNGGVYSVTEFRESVLRGSRLTGDKKYTDLFDLSFAEDSNGGCEVTACSESQVRSVLDFSTNYCNLRMLYCNKKDGCEVVKHDLNYKEKFGFGSCSQRVKEKCLPEKMQA